MRSIGSLILNVIILIILIILIGIAAMILSTVFNAMSILSGAEYNAQYSSYSTFYNNCLNNANIYGFNSSVCNQLLNVTNNTGNVLIKTGEYTGTFSDPIIWAIILTILTAGVYVVSLQGIQLGQNNVKVRTRKRR
jgi:uncharacterized membrane protein